MRMDFYMLPAINSLVPRLLTKAYYVAMHAYLLVNPSTLRHELLCRGAACHGMQL